jgi:hypothetical protein
MSEIYHVTFAASHSPPQNEQATLERILQFLKYNPDNFGGTAQSQKISRGSTKVSGHFVPSITFCRIPSVRFFFGPFVGSLVRCLFVLLLSIHSFRPSPSIVHSFRLFLPYSFRSFLLWSIRRFLGSLCVWLVKWVVRSFVRFSIHSFSITSWHYFRPFRISAHSFLPSVPFLPSIPSIPPLFSVIPFRPFLPFFSSVLFFRSFLPFFTFHPLDLTAKSDG